MTRNRYYGGLFLFSLEISINNSYGSQHITNYPIHNYPILCLSFEVSRRSDDFAHFAIWLPLSSSSVPLLFDLYHSSRHFSNSGVKFYFAPVRLTAWCHLTDVAFYNTCSALRGSHCQMPYSISCRKCRTVHVM